MVSTVQFDAGAQEWYIPKGYPGTVWKDAPLKEMVYDETKTSWGCWYNRHEVIMSSKDHLLIKKFDEANQLWFLKVEKSK